MPSLVKVSDQAKLFSSILRNDSGLIGSDPRSVSDINQNKGGLATVYRTFDDGYIVRAMTPADIDIVVEWFSHIESIARCHLAIVLAVFPPGPGFYIGELDGEVTSCIWSRLSSF